MRLIIFFLNWHNKSKDGIILLRSKFFREKGMDTLSLCKNPFYVLKFSVSDLFRGLNKQQVEAWLHLPSWSTIAVKHAKHQESYSLICSPEKSSLRPTGFRVSKVWVHQSCHEFLSTSHCVQNNLLYRGSHGGCGSWKDSATGEFKSIHFMELLCSLILFLRFAGHFAHINFSFFIFFLLHVIKPLLRKHPNRPYWMCFCWYVYRPFTFSPQIDL